jgi:hypothetical protein
MMKFTIGSKRSRARKVTPSMSREEGGHEGEKRRKIFF